ncbi:MAG: hypothetical protein R2692_06770 [Microbacterium sp.]
MAADASGSKAASLLERCQEGDDSPRVAGIDEVIALATKLQAPIVHALRGKEHIEWQNPYDVGMTGLLGFASGYRAMEKCDALLMLGTDFPYRQFFPEKAKIVQVDLRGEQLGRRTPIDLGLVGGVRETAEALLPLIDEGRSDSFAKESVEHYRKTRKGSMSSPSTTAKAADPPAVRRATARRTGE